MNEAATHNQKRDEVGEDKVGQVVTEGKNAYYEYHIFIVVSYVIIFLYGSVSAGREKCLLNGIF